MNEEILAKVTEAETAIAETLGGFLSDTGLKLEAIELADPSADPPVVKLKVALATGEEETPAEGGDAATLEAEAEAALAAGDQDKYNQIMDQLLKMQSA